MQTYASVRRRFPPPFSRARFMPGVRCISTLALVLFATALGIGCDDPPDGSGCPSGSIAQPDGTCMPVGIQGCAEVFLGPDHLCHPSMAKCADHPGTIPKFDEGCVPVGIQGCAKLFMEDDGLCHPTMAKCPAGTIVDDSADPQDFALGDPRNNDRSKLTLWIAEK